MLMMPSELLPVIDTKSSVGRDAFLVVLQKVTLTQNAQTIANLGIFISAESDARAIDKRGGRSTLKSRASTSYSEGTSQLRCTKDC